MDNEKITFKRKATAYRPGTAVGVSREVNRKLAVIVEETGLTMSAVATRLLTFALEHMEYEDE